MAEIFKITGHKAQRDVLVGGRNVDIWAAFPIRLGRQDQVTYINCVYDHKVTYSEIKLRLDSSLCWNDSLGDRIY